MSEKLQKVLARAGVGSRREMETFIADGRVKVNGEVAELGMRVTDADNISVDGKDVTTTSSTEQFCRVLAYNKPEGELCTRHDPEGRRTVFDRLPTIKDGRWIAVGRLDINTSGLLLFTNDGELANRLMHPSHEVEREYSVRVYGEVDRDMLQRLRGGVRLEDGPARFKHIREAGGEGQNKWFHCTLTSGRNREVRRLWESQEVQVSRLIRLRYGDVTLPRQLPQGGWQELPLEQVNYLRKLVKLRPETESKVAVDKHARTTKTARIRRAVKKNKVREHSQKRRR